jgi:predicted nucleic acid-binding protein
MVLFDAAILSIAIDPKANVPSDFRTGQLIPQARERVDALIRGLEQDGQAIIIPTPALAEALTTLAEKAIELTDQIERRSCFRIKPFGKKEAIEIAIRTKMAILAGDKREGIADPWQKVKYDRQIIAVAKTENVAAIYSTDRAIHEHAKLWGIPVLHLADVPLGAPSGTQDVLGLGEADETSTST